MGLQSVLGWWITKCGNSGLQTVLGVGLQMQNGLQIALEITKCGRVDYKVLQWLQSGAELQSELVQKVLVILQVKAGKTMIKES